MSQSPPALRSRRVKWIWITGSAMGVALGVVVAIVLYRGWRHDQQKVGAASELSELIAEIDRSEPMGWDLAALERMRANVPNDRNGADVARRAWEMLPAGWEENRDLPEITPGGILSGAG